jgi:hypothetical protein
MKSNEMKWPRRNKLKEKERFPGIKKGTKLCNLKQKEKRE